MSNMLVLPVSCTFKIYSRTLSVIGLHLAYLPYYILAVRYIKPGAIIPTHQQTPNIINSKHRTMGTRRRVVPLGNSILICFTCSLLGNLISGLAFFRCTEFGGTCQPFQQFLADAFLFLPD